LATGLLLAKGADNVYAMLDSTTVRERQHSTGAKKDGEQAIAGGLSTNMHTTCNAPGNPTRFYLPPGQHHDLDGAEALMNKLTQAQAALADKVYDADEAM
jgi:hypothetical protein